MPLIFRKNEKSPAPTIYPTTKGGYLVSCFGWVSFDFETGTTNPLFAITGSLSCQGKMFAQTNAQAEAYVKGFEENAILVLKGDFAKGDYKVTDKAGKESWVKADPKLTIRKAAKADIASSADNSGVFEETVQDSSSSVADDAFVDDDPS